MEYMHQLFKTILSVLATLGIFTGGQVLDHNMNFNNEEPLEIDTSLLISADDPNLEASLSDDTDLEVPPEPVLASTQDTPSVLGVTTTQETTPSPDPEPEPEDKDCDKDHDEDKDYDYEYKNEYQEKLEFNWDFDWEGEKDHDKDHNDEHRSSKQQHRD